MDASSSSRKFRSADSAAAANLPEITVTADAAHEWLFLRFGYNQTIVDLVKKIPRKSWIPEKKLWSIPFRDDYKKFLAGHFKSIARCSFIDEKKKEPENRSPEKSPEAKDAPVGTVSAKVPPPASPRAVPQEFPDYLIKKRYSRNTIRNYCAQITRFLSFCNKQENDLTEADASGYILYLAKNERYSSSYQKLAIHAIRCFFDHILKKPISSDSLSWPRAEKKLPEVFNVEEVTAILSALKNLKHRTILWIIYSGGIRISEAVYLRISDIDFSRRLIYVRKGKGKKDRYTLLSAKAAAIVKEYLAEYSPKVWLFEGQKGGQYTVKSITNIFHNALSRTNIKKPVTVHTLRHTFATHLHENGVDIRYIQELLGHSNPKTTEIYTHVSRSSLEKIRSPLDYLDL